MLDSYLSDSLDNLSWSLMNLEIFSPPMNFLISALLFARLLCSLQPISCSFHSCCCPYLYYHLIMIVGLFLDYTSIWAQPVTICYRALACLLTTLLLDPYPLHLLPASDLLTSWGGNPKNHDLAHSNTHLYHPKLWWSPVSAWTPSLGWACIIHQGDLLVYLSCWSVRTPLLL